MYIHATHLTTGSRMGELGDQRQTHDSLFTGGDGQGTDGQGQLPLPCQCYIKE